MTVTQPWRASRARAAGGRASAARGRRSRSRRAGPRLWALLNAQALLNGAAGAPGGVVPIEDDRRPITASVPGHPVLVRCTTADLGAAIDALIQNVFAHTPDGTAMRVNVTPDPAGGGTLTVTDDGPGFPADVDLSRGVGSGTSTGLGLDIARRTAESAGGTMTLRNGNPAGADITLTFGAPG